MTVRALLVLTLSASVVAGCSPGRTPEAGPPGTSDSGPTDSGTADAGTHDSGPMVLDGGPDAGSRDSGPNVLDGGPDAGCVPESEQQMCGEFAYNCGSLTVSNNCGTVVTVASCGTCGTNAYCDSTTQNCVCDNGFFGNGQICDPDGTDSGPNGPDAGCTPESNQELCAAHDYICGSLTAVNNCGNTVTVASCGACGANANCSSTTWSCVCDTGFTGNGETCTANQTDAGITVNSCTVDSECAAHATTPYCDVLGHVCVSCTTSLQCTADGGAGTTEVGTAPDICVIANSSQSVFSETRATCTSPLVVGDCVVPDGSPNPCPAMTPNQPLCDVTNGACVQCLTGTDCPADGGYVCNAGACAEVCETGLQNCSGTCRYLAVDPKNCGACGHVCSTGDYCLNSACAACSTIYDGGPGADVVACGDICTNLKSDQFNCGGCFNVCTAGDACVDGACVNCSTVDAGPTGASEFCGIGCINYEADPLNCGGCGTVCGTGKSCVGGSCTCSKDTDCTSDTIAPFCDVKSGVCVACTSNAQCTTSIESGGGNICNLIQGSASGNGAYCSSTNQGGASCAASNFCTSYPDQPLCNPVTGDCVQCLAGTDCPTGYVCNGGACAESCSTGTSDCTGTCADLSTNHKNCGTCGHACGASKVCVSAACAAACAAGTTDCGETCIPTTSDPNNCGGCGVTCDTTSTCTNSACVECASDLDAGPNGLFEGCNNACVNVVSDVSNCGYCGNICAAGMICSNYECETPCTTNAQCAGTAAQHVCDVAGGGICVSSDLCTATEQEARWATMLSSPILPPNAAAGLNLAGFIGTGVATAPLKPYWVAGDNLTWDGITVQQAEGVNCQGTEIGTYFGGTDEFAISWSNDAVVLDSIVPGAVANYIGLNFGYLGELNFACTAAACGSTYAKTAFKMKLDGTTIQMATDGVDFVTIGGSTGLDWVDAANGDATAMQPFDLMYRALIATFTTLPAEPAGVTCNTTNACEIIYFPGGSVCNNGNGQAGAVMFVGALDWAFWAQPVTTPTGASTACRMDLYLVPLASAPVP